MSAAIFPIVKEANGEPHLAYTIGQTPRDHLVHFASPRITTRQPSRMQLTNQTFGYTWFLALGHNIISAGRCCYPSQDEIT